nr:MAG TPA: endosialidase chaperone [Caudoviricetes sp.]
MTTYNTGNPLGSSAAKDLNDNAQNMDYLMNDQVNERRKDRFGHSRKTWHGMESAHEEQLARFSADFQQFLVKSGYEFLGDYEEGPITFTARNQSIRYQGQFWKLNAATNITFTTTGTESTSWVEDVKHFVLMDADTLRQELGLQDGAWLVGLGDLTLGEILAQKIFIIVITGQSNAVGANSGGPNPASDKIVIWDGATGDWGSSDYTRPPLSRSSPNGNVGNNNIALAFAHRLVDEFKAEKVFIIYDAASGRPIEDWMGDGVNSERYAAIKNKVEAAFASQEIIATGKTEIDFLVFAQGEENALTDTVTDYRTKLATLDKQFRAESWMSDTTPMFIMGMSGLHMRYQIWQAQVDYCENYNRNCIYVNSAGLLTQYEVDQTGDYTHWLGKSLWEHGYYRIWQALHERGVTHRLTLPAFYSRGVGAWNGNNIAIAGFSSLVSAGSTTSDFPKNGPAAAHSIHWGYQCTAANYSLAGGYQITMQTGANYSVSWGRLNTFSAVAQYSSAFGYGNTINAPYAFAAGRGHTIADSYCAALGAFSEYKTSLEDPVRFQVGTGKAEVSPKTGFAVFESGRALFSGNIDFRTDNAFSVGTPGARASVIYAGTAAINTSDITTKKSRGALTDAELRAWAKVPPTIYQILESLNEKGEDARLHAGLIAQNVATAFESEGLDPRRYALFCEDEIFEEVFEPQIRTVSRQKRGPGVIRESGIVDGVEVTVERRVEDALQYKLVNDEFVPEIEEVEETVMIPVRKSAGIRLGLRYTECLIFEAAYQRSVSTKLAARLDELEIGRASLNQ